MGEFNDVEQIINEINQKKGIISHEPSVDEIIAEYSNKVVKNQEEIDRDYYATVEAINKAYEEKKKERELQEQSKSDMDKFVDSLVEFYYTRNGKIESQSTPSVATENKANTETVTSISDVVKEEEAKKANTDMHFDLPAQEASNNEVIIEPLGVMTKSDVSIPELEKELEDAEKFIAQAIRLKNQYKRSKQLYVSYNDVIETQSKYIEALKTKIADMKEYEATKARLNFALDKANENVEYLDTTPNETHEEVKEEKNEEVETDVPAFTSSDKEAIEDIPVPANEDVSETEAPTSEETIETDTPAFTSGNDNVAETEAPANEEEIDEVESDIPESSEEEVEHVDTDVPEDKEVIEQTDTDDEEVQEEVEQTDETNSLSVQEHVTVLERDIRKTEKAISVLDTLIANNKHKIRITDYLYKEFKTTEYNAKQASYEHHEEIYTAKKTELEDIKNSLESFKSRIASLVILEVEQLVEFKELQSRYEKALTSISMELNANLDKAENELSDVKAKLKTLKGQKDAKSKKEYKQLKDMRFRLRKEIIVIKNYLGKYKIRKAIAAVSTALVVGLTGSGVLSLTGCRNRAQDKDKDDIIVTTTLDEEEDYTSSYDLPSLVTSVPEYTDTITTTEPIVTTVPETTIAPATTKAPETTTAPVTTAATTTKKETTTVATTKKATTKATTTESTVETYDTEIVEKDDLQDSNNYNSSYQNDYSSIQQRYVLSNEKTIELVNRAYTLREAGYFEGASLDDIVLMLIRFDNGEEMYYDQQIIKDTFAKVTVDFGNAYAHNESITISSEDRSIIRALPALFTDGSLAQTWVTNYSRSLLNILDDPYNDRYKEEAIQLADSLRSFIANITFVNGTISAEDYQNATTYYGIYESVVVPSETLLASTNPNVANYYYEVIQTLEIEFEPIKDIVCNYVRILAPTQGHYIEEEEVDVY